MKISHLQEGSVSGDPAITQNNQQAPRFGRHPTTLEQVSNVPNIGFKSARNPKVLEKQVDETTTAGSVASVSQPIGKMNKRSSIFSGIKTSKKYANSPVTEDELSEEQLLAKQLKQELFKKAKLRDIGKKARISDVLHKKQLEQIMFNKTMALDEEDNDFWYHGPHSIARECYYNTNNPVLTTEDIHHLFNTKPPKHINVINNKPYMEKPDVANILKAHKELTESAEIPVDSNKVFQSMGQQLIQIGSQADKIKHHDPEEIKKAIVNKLNEIDDPRLTHATKTLLQKTVEFNRKHPKVMAAAFGLIFAILARVSMEVSHRLGLNPTQATLIIEAILPTLGNFAGYLVNGFSVKDSIQSGLIAGSIGVAGTLAASSAINEFATGGGSDSGNYFRELASAWYNGAYDSGSLEKGIKTNQDIERLLQRGIVAPDGKTRKYNIDYNSDFDGVIIFSDDYYEHGDHDDTIDSRTGQKWGPYDYMEFSDDELSEGVAEAREAATAATRAELKKRKRKEDPIQQDKKKKDSDAAWERLMQYAADQKKGQQGVAEVSDKTLQNYLSRADKQVNNRLSRMGQARERLNKNYEIYDVENPTRIIDKFEANTPELAREYYSKFIKEYNPGDQDFHFELRRSTGLSEQDLAEQELEEKWSQKYKDSINCSNPKGFSQKAHCAGKKKNNESLEKDLFKADFSKYSTPTLMNFLKTFAKQKNPNTEIQTAISKELLNRANKQQPDKVEKCPHCGGPIFNEMIMNEKKDACYYKVKSRYKVWPSAYASGALVKCRKSHGNWGNGSKANESVEQIEENLHKWFKEKWVRFGPDGKIRGACARGDDSEGKPKCLPQSKAHSLGKKARASAAARKRREDPNPERHGKAINVATKKKKA